MVDIFEPRALSAAFYLIFFLQWSAADPGRWFDKVMPWSAARHGHPATAVQRMIVIGSVLGEAASCRVCYRK